MNLPLGRGGIPGVEPSYFRVFGRGFLSYGHNQSRKEYLSKLARTAFRISSSSTSNSSSNFFLWLTSICIFRASSLFIPVVFTPPSLEAGREDMVSAWSTGESRFQHGFAQYMRHRYNALSLSRTLRASPRHVVPSPRVQ